MRDGAEPDGRDEEGQGLFIMASGHMGGRPSSVPERADTGMLGPEEQALYGLVVHSGKWGSWGLSFIL